MALTNFVTSIVIARNFDEKYFATYLSVAALLAIISIPMQSIQTAYAIHPDKQEIRISLPRIHRSGTSVRSIIALLAMIWFCSLPILLKFSGIELNTLLASSALFLVLLPSNIVSGKLRNLERFSSWRVLLAGTALIQIPIAVFTATLNLDLWLYLLLLCAPSLVYSNDVQQAFCLCRVVERVLLACFLLQFTATAYFFCQINCWCEPWLNINFLFFFDCNIAG
jgi:hypothetical protein